MIKKIIAGVAVVASALSVGAEGVVVSVDSPVTSIAALADGGKFVLHNVGRDKYISENPYGSLEMSGKPVTGCDSSLDYVLTVTPDGNGLYTFTTRRGRFIPEVADKTVESVGHAANAGHFTISAAPNGHFTIVNSKAPDYGWDASASAFVGWNAAQGSNCYYDFLPVEFGAGDYPLESYVEPDGGEVIDPAAWDSLDRGEIYLSWASKDVNYDRRRVPALRMAADTTLYAWRGERAAVKAVVFAPAGCGPLSVSLSDWTDAGGAKAVDSDAAQARWMRYVITDGYAACGTHPSDLDTWTVADVIDLDAPASIQERSVRPVWCTLEVPRDIAAGVYDLTLEVADAASGRAVGSLGLKVQVRDHTLPLHADQRFHLDLWQQPYAVARYHGVERWSDAHFEAMRPYMQALARAGQKVVSAILFHEPWGDQSHDKFDPMVETTRCADGSWRFDYTVFDRWVSFMEECGISARINCFSMIPWDMSFRYVDEATDTYKFLKTSTSSTAYADLWSAFLTDFAAHLREKGWFEKTAIAMDERGLDAMLDAAALVRRTVPDMKLALAGNYHSELVDVVDDYCLAYAQRFSEAELAARHAAGRISTVYTCCTESRPNLFTNSAPAEAAYLPLQAIISGHDGYLRWAWINWAEQPLTDSRFRLFGSGDTYSFYPGPRSSVRFERLIEGIQQSEKIHILRQEWAAAGHTDSIRALEAAMEPFRSGVSSYYNSPSSMVNNLEAVVNGSPAPAPEVAEEYCNVSLSADKRDVALQKRWLSVVKTQGARVNLDYTSDGSDNATGVIVAPRGIEVLPGSSFSLRLKATTNDDDLTYCRLAVGADWNRDFIVHPVDELIGRYGSSGKQNAQLRDQKIYVDVPADAVPGASLLRVVYADAWVAEPDFCGELYKGFAFDIPMAIIDPNSSIAEVDADSRTRWQGTRLSASEPVEVRVYGLSGLLLHHAEGVMAYDLLAFTPGWYHVVVTYPDSHRESFSKLR